MRSAFVDNSTLTAVQRLVGDIPVQPDYAVEGDLAAFDQYVQALLLYDEVAAIDDYKPQYRAERKGRFSELRFISPTEREYRSADEQARAATEDIFLKIKGGELGSDPLGKFLKSLDLHVAPAWQLQSSDWFLRLRLLSDEAGIALPKYGTLMGAIFSQLNQNKRSNAPPRWDKELRASDGSAIPDTSGIRHNGMRVVNSDIKAFAAGLNWMSQRSVFYMLLAQAYDAAFILHPIRHNFLAEFSVKELGTDLSPRFRDDFLRFFSSSAAIVTGQSHEVLGEPAIRLSMPFFAAWAVSHAGTPAKAYEHILEVRHSAEARSLRKRFREIEALLQTDVLAMRRQASKLYQALTADLGDLQRRFGKARDEDLTLSVSLATFAPSLSSKSLSRRLSKIIPSSSRKATTLLRNITLDILRAPMLGKLSDRFSASLKFDQQAEFVTIDPKVDPTRFRRAKSHWKQPM